MLHQGEPFKANQLALPVLAAVAYDHDNPRCLLLSFSQPPGGGHALPYCASIALDASGVPVSEVRPPPSPPPPPTPHPHARPHAPTHARSHKAGFSDPTPQGGSAGKSGERIRVPAEGEVVLVICNPEQTPVRCTLARTLRLALRLSRVVMVPLTTAVAFPPRSSNTLHNPCATPFTPFTTTFLFSTSSRASPTPPPLLLRCRCIHSASVTT